MKRVLLAVVSLLPVAGITAVWVGCASRPIPDPGPAKVKARPDDPAAVKELEKLGASLERDNAEKNKPVISARLQGFVIDDKSFAHIAGLPNLQTLVLLGTRITD